MGSKPSKHVIMSPPSELGGADFEYFCNFENAEHPRGSTFAKKKGKCLNPRGQTAEKLELVEPQRVQMFNFHYAGF